MFHFVETSGDTFQALAYLPKQLTEIGQALKDNFSFEKIIEGITDMDVKATKVITTFGQGRDNLLNIKQAVAAARDDIIKLGGSMEDTWKIQDGYASSMQRNIILGREGQRDLFQAQQVTGVEVGKLTTGFQDVGISALDVTKNVNKIIGATTEFGVSAQKVTADVMRNMSLMNQYNFQGGVEGMAKMAAQATALRVDMTSTMNVAQKAFEPEGAIKMSAALQRLGVTQSELLDPMRLMNLSQNDPAELQNQIAQMTKQFVHMNKEGNFEILPGAKLQMKYISEAMGISQQELSKMALSSAELDEKLKRIQFPSLASEEDKKLLASLTQMKDGRMVITVNGEEMDLEDALKEARSSDDIKQLIEAAKPKTVEQLAQDQLDVMEEMNMGIQLMTGKLPTIYGATRAGQATIKGMAGLRRQLMEQSQERMFGAGGSQGYRQRLSQQTDAQANRISQQGTGSFTNAGQVINALGAMATSVTTSMTQVTIGSAQAFADLARMIGTGNTSNGGIGEVTIQNFQQVATAIGDSIRRALRRGNDVIISEEGMIQTDEKDTIFAMTGGDKMLEMLKNFGNMTKAGGIDMTPQIMAMAMLTGQQKPKEGGGGGVTNKEEKIVTLNINASKEIDKDHLERILKDQGVTAAIINNIKNVTTNYNRTPIV